MTEPRFDAAAFDAAFDRSPRPSVPAVVAVAVPSTAAGIGGYITAVCAGVAAAPNGQRNDKLNNAAFSVGRIVAGGQLEAADAVAALTDAAGSAGLTPSETAATISSGMAAGAREPRQLDTNPAVGPVTVLDALTVITAAQAEPPSRRLVLTAASSVQPERQRWLWADRIPAGALCLLAGREGLGKSTLAVDLAAQVTRGELAGEFHGHPRDVLIVATEDNRSTTIVPRLIAAGADLDRVHFVDVEEDGLTGAPVFPVDTDRLAGAARARGAVLVILDAATSVIDGRLDGDRDRQMRQALEPLGRMAADLDASVLGVVHFGKRADADTGKLILGSIAWSQVARSVLAVAVDEDSGVLLVQPTKHNLGPGDVRSIGARIVPATVPTGDGPTSVGRVEWLGEVDADARDHLGRRADDAEDRTERDEAGQWLSDYLAGQGGEAAAGQAIKAARADGIAERTLQRARSRAGVVSVKSGMHGGWVWQLSDRRRHEGAEDATHMHVAPSAPSVAPSGPPPETDDSRRIHEGTEEPTSHGLDSSVPSVDSAGPEIGPCTRCCAATRRYGDDADSLCRSCRTAP